MSLTGITVQINQGQLWKQSEYYRNRWQISFKTYSDKEVIDYFNQYKVGLGDQALNTVLNLFTELHNIFAVPTYNLTRRNIVL